MHLTLSDSTRLYYENHGDPAAPVVLLINGLTSDTSAWGQHVPTLAAHYRVLVYDCRGQGQSDKPADPYLTNRHAQDAIELLDVLAIEQVHVVGYSNGGAVAMTIAALQPQRIATLTLAFTFTHVEPLLNAKMTAWLQALEVGGAGHRFDMALPAIWSNAFLEANYAALLALRAKAAAHPVHAVRNLIHGLLHHDARPHLSAITAPTLIVTGEEDILIHRFHSHDLYAALPASRLVVIPDAAHGWVIEEAEAFMALLLEHIGT
jgi:3-oxoadipate enol-lactonase